MATAAMGWERIDLSRAPGFALGDLEVRPSLREVKGRSQSLVLEPRVMQVLVALAERRGEIVGHEELLARCWDGRVIGDNAIHRVIGLLRDMLDASGVGDEIAIETIAKVGYRLVLGVESKPTSILPTATGDPAAARWASARLFRWGWALLIVPLFAGGLVIGSGPGELTEPVRIAIDVETDPASTMLARDLSTDLAGHAAGRPSEAMTVLSPEAGGPFDFRLRVRLTAANERRRAVLTITSRDDTGILWAANLDVAHSEPLSSRAAALASPVLACLADQAVRAERLDSYTLRIFLAACQRLTDFPDGERARLLGLVVERRPGFMLARAELAFALAYLAAANAQPPAETARLRQAAESHVAAVRGRGNGLGGVYLAQARLVERRDWSRRLQLIEQGLRAVPDDARLHDEYSFALSTTGRMGASIASARRAVELNPYSPEHRNALISALAYTGYVDAARAELEQAQRIWPQSESLREVGFRFHLRFGDPAIALRLLSEGGGNMGGPSDVGWRMAATFIAARLSPTAQRVDEALNAQNYPGQSSPGLSLWQIQALGYFNRVEETFRLLADPAVEVRLWEAPEVLFRYDLRSLQHDRRFMALMHRFGLVRFWRRTGQWPDFCSDPDIRYNCRLEADRLIASQQGGRTVSASRS